MSAQDKSQGNTQAPTIKNIYRLTPSQYQELEKKALAKYHFRDDTGPVQAGHLVGIETVLRLVREGFVSQ